MPNYRLLKLKVSPVRAAQTGWLFPASANSQDKLSFVRTLPQELFGDEAFGVRLAELFEIEVLPEVVDHRWDPPTNPGRVELTSHLELFKKGLAQGGLALTPEMLTTLIASTKEALRTMHELPWAG